MFKAQMKERRMRVGDETFGCLVDRRGVVKVAEVEEGRTYHADRMR